MKKIKYSTNICPMLCATVVGLGACSSDDIEPFSLDNSDASDRAENPAENSIDPFFQKYLGAWQSPCLFEPDRLTGPTTGDYVVYVLTFTATQTIWAYQDYMDEDCMELWPHGAGSVTNAFQFSTRIVSESGLDGAVFLRDAGITIVESVTGDPTPNDDSGSSASISTLTSSVPVLDIAHLSPSGDLFLGEQTSTKDHNNVPTQLDFNNAWINSGDSREK